MVNTVSMSIEFNQLPALLRLHKQFIVMTHHPEIETSFASPFVVIYRQSFDSPSNCSGEKIFLRATLAISARQAIIINHRGKAPANVLTVLCEGCRTLLRYEMKSNCCWLLECG